MFYLLHISKFSETVSVESLLKAFAFLFDPDGILFLQNLFLLDFATSIPVLFLFCCVCSLFSPSPLEETP